MEHLLHNVPRSSRVDCAGAIGLIAFFLLLACGVLEALAVAIIGGLR